MKLSETMARRLRYHFPGATYHVMLRGNNGQAIFFSDRDRCRMCLFLQEGVEKFGHRILAFCFMTNHVHLIIQVGDISISQIIQNLAFRYTRYINWQHDRIGHLFQGRFRSVIVDSRRYLKELVRYIHLNPVRASLVQHPQDYRWSSHHAYLTPNEFTWLTCDCTLQRFSSDRQKAIEAFHSFVLSGVGIDEELNFESGVLEGALGDDDFLRMLMQNCQSHDYKLGRLNLEDLVKLISQRYKIDWDALQTHNKNRKLSHIRAVLALLIRDIENIKLQELADFLGRDVSGLSRAASQLEAKSRKNALFAQELKELHQQLYQMSKCQA